MRMIRFLLTFIFLVWLLIVAWPLFLVLTIILIVTWWRFLRKVTVIHQNTFSQETQRPPFIASDDIIDAEYQEKDITHDSTKF
mgnify:CR=1 FL=1